MSDPSTICRVSTGLPPNIRKALVDLATAMIDEVVANDATRGKNKIISLYSLSTSVTASLLESVNNFIAEGTMDQAEKEAKS